jgi:surface polysaccharide O-acyltransferase-like enzyme
VSRNQGVDTFRTLAIIAVIAIHTTPFETTASPIGRALDLATVINQAARFAVPFFYVASGYYWARKVGEVGQVVGPTLQMVRRLGFLWLAWSAIYLLPFNIVDALHHGALGPLKVMYWHLTQALDKPLIAVLEGTRPHLWFLVGLMFSVSMCAFALHHDLRRGLVVVAAALYAIGLAGTAYSSASFGFRIDSSFRNGHLFAPAFFVTGFFLQGRESTAGWLRAGLLLTGAGLLLHFLEVLALHGHWGTPLAHDYVAGTYPLGVGVALMALSGARPPGLRAFAAIGPSVLGIYTSHVMFVEMLQPVDRRFTGAPAWEVAYVVVVFLLSWLLTRLLSRHPWASRLVT